MGLKLILVPRRLTRLGSNASPRRPRSPPPRSAASSHCAACRACRSTRHRRTTQGHQRRRRPRRTLRRHRGRRSPPPAAGPCLKCRQAGEQHYKYNDERREKVRAHPTSESDVTRRGSQDAERSSPLFVCAELRTSPYSNVPIFFCYTSCVLPFANLTNPITFC